MSNLVKIQALLAAYTRKDVTAVQSVMADDIIWRIPGHHPLAGPKHGITAHAFSVTPGLIFCGPRLIGSVILRPCKQPFRYQTMSCKLLW